MQAALIEEGVCVDMVMADPAEIQDGRLWVDGTGGTIGQEWNGAWVARALTPIEQRREAAWESIKLERDRRCELGVKVGSTWFHSDAKKSRIQQIGLTVYVPPNCYWKTLTFAGPSVFVPMTSALAMSIVQATAVSDVAIHTAAEVHNALMRQSASPETYDYRVSWPHSIEDEANEAGIQFDASVL